MADFHTIQANSTALLYFKRYLSREFSEQNVMFLQEVREFAAGSHVHPSFATPLAMNRSTSIPSEGAQETKVSSVPLSFAVPDPEAGAELGNADSR